MDSTIKNISQLQEALAKMKRPSEFPTPNSSRSSTPITPGPNAPDYHYPIKQEDPASEYSTPNVNLRPQSSADRTSSMQLSTSGLLTNMIAHQTSTNKKIDALTDAVFRLHRTVETMSKEQVRQNDLLAAIVRNTANMQITVNESSSSGKSGKSKSSSIKDYGFSTAKQLFAEFLLKLLNEVKKQVTQKGKVYKSTRDFDSKLASQLIKAAMDNQFKINGVVHAKLEANSTNHPSLVKVASRIGSTDNTNPMLTPESFRELVDDVDTNFFISNLEHILDRLRIIRILIPFYESDIISALQYPYFNRNQEAVCDWHKIIPRSETANEARVVNLSATERNKLAEYMAKGISEKSALNAVLGGN